MCSRILFIVEKVVNFLSLACSSLNSNCIECTGLTQCTKCSSSSGLVASGAQCLASCPTGSSALNGVCVGKHSFVLFVLRI